MPVNERPRERLQRVGAENLSALELLGIVLSSGHKDEPVLKVAQRLLDRFDNIETLAVSSLEELQTVKGIGPAKACQIKAAFELANRWDRSAKNTLRRKISSPEEAYQELRGKSRGKNKEHFWAILLNTRNMVIKLVEISVGSLDTSIVHPREVFKEAISASASSIIVAHNHPSGNPEPSQDDIRLSKRLKEAGDLVGIAVVDHLVIGDGRYISLKREGLL
ncbi:MAG: DNA repair protein RadC [Dehalococcoidales bacterium]|nr:DNA repair protein RadC [Dehalococcoidales bacterium]